MTSKVRIDALHARDRYCVYHAFTYHLGYFGRRTSGVYFKMKRITTHASVWHDVARHVRYKQLGAAFAN